MVEGWDDDLDLDLGEEDPGEEGDGWDDDGLDDLDDSDQQLDERNQNQANVNQVGEEPTIPPEVSVPGRQLSENEKHLCHLLVEYVGSLQSMMPSINQLLDAEYNSLDHAFQLRDYYDSRPQLRDYTLETELPRMHYVVVLENNDVLTEKVDVHAYLSKQPNSMIVRCANQSLLADILGVLTGPDLFIRSQYFATAIATSCKFTVYATEIVCECRMALSLPSETGERFEVAHFDVSIHVQPEIPMIQYRVQTVDVSSDPLKGLEEAAIFIGQMTEGDLQPEPMPSNADAFRDSFLAQVSKTHEFVQASHTGLSSAWRQIDSVANVTEKINFVGRILPSLSSNDDDLDPGHSQIPANAQEPDQSDSYRPAPIIGGFLMSGISRLAKSVTRPDEDEQIDFRAIAQDNQRALAGTHEHTTNLPLPVPAPPMPPASAPEHHVQLYQRDTEEQDDQGWADHDELDSELATSTGATDGWDHDDLETEIIFEDPPTSTHATRAISNPTETRTKQQATDHARVMGEETNLADQAPLFDDIFETRVRWVNPRF